jgi:hypothetical protein
VSDVVVACQITKFVIDGISSQELDDAGQIPDFASSRILVDERSPDAAEQLSIATELGSMVRSLFDKSLLVAVAFSSHRLHS